MKSLDPPARSLTNFFCEEPRPLPARALTPHHSVEPKHSLVAPTRHTYLSLTGRVRTMHVFSGGSGLPSMMCHRAPFPPMVLADLVHGILGVVLHSRQLSLITCIMHTHQRQACQSIKMVKNPTIPYIISLGPKAKMTEQKCLRKQMQFALSCQ